MSMQKLPTMILAGFLTLIMPVMLNAIVVNPAIAQTDTDTDSDDDDDNDSSTPVGGVETGAGGTAVDGVNSAIPITVGGLALLGAGASAVYSRRRNK